MVGTGGFVRLSFHLTLSARSELLNRGRDPKTTGKLPSGWLLEDEDAIFEVYSNSEIGVTHISRLLGQEAAISRKDATGWRPSLLGTRTLLGLKKAVDGHDIRWTLEEPSCAKHALSCHASTWLTKWSPAVLEVYTFMAFQAGQQLPNLSNSWQFEMKSIVH